MYLTALSSPVRRGVFDVAVVYSTL